MWKHYSFWGAGSTGCINNCRQVFILNFIRWFFYFFQILRSQFNQYFFPVFCIGYMFKSVNCFYWRGSFFYAQNFMIQLFIINKNHFYLCIIKNKLKFIYINSRINRCQHSTGLLNSKIEHYPFRPVLTKNGNLIPSLDCSIATSYSHIH